ncbi:MAG: PBSX family phage terminase large subunit [Dysosmobacter sp.]|nr:PBSX family phage terminase large subunit [Dysosmobacter sp.]MDY3867375.1 PBSX family phage terminase large subunit [Dysosmobacter sp.]
MENETLRFSPKQRQVLTWWQTGRWQALICDGAVRSGKTFCMGLSFFLWAQHDFNGRQFALCGKTVGALRRNLLTELVPCLRRIGMEVRENRSANTLTVVYAGHRNQFLLFGGKDASSAALIQGSTLAGLLLDETALMPRAFVEQAVARCSVRGSRLWFNCNPEGPEHWFYKEWIEKAESRGALRLHFTMEDNPGLPPEIRQRYERLYTGVFYRRFVLGEWAAAQGLVYDFFDPDKDAAEVPDGPFSAWRVSVDYGTVNPLSMGLWGEKNGVWYRVEEVYYDSRREGQQKTDAEYAEMLEQLVAGRDIQRVIVDPSAASFIETLRRKGWQVMKADNDVADGIRVTADLLRQRRIVLCRPCRDCLREMALYCWDERSGRDAPRKEHDHAMDEMRYFAMDLAGERSGGFAAISVVRKI